MSSKDYYASLWDTAEELNRNDCFNDLAYRNMTFDRDDRPEHILSKAARAYAENFQPALEQHGIMFTGNVGTGKTFYACCIANAVIDRGCTAWVTTLQPLVRALCSYEAAEKILAKIRKVDLLVLDDLGSTALNDFTTDKIFEIVAPASRLSSRLTLIRTRRGSPVSACGEFSTACGSAAAMWWWTGNRAGERAERLRHNVPVEAWLRGYPRETLRLFPRALASTMQRQRFPRSGYCGCTLFYERTKI